MPVFQVLALLSPLAVGFGVPAALAATAAAPPKRRAAAAGSAVLAVLLLLLAASFAGSPKAWPPLAALLLSFGLFSAGVYLLAESARVPRDLAQVLSGLAVCVLMSTLFWAAPLIRDAADRGAAGDAIDRRISLALDANPFFVIGYSIFDVDMIHESPFFYRLGMADFMHGTPSWAASSAGFALAGLALAGLGAALRRVLKP